MKCTKCNAELLQGAAFCVNCGAAVENDATVVVTGGTAAASPNSKPAEPYKPAPIYNNTPSAPSYESESLKSPGKKISGGLIALIIVLVILIAGGVTVGVLIANGTIDLEEIFAGDSEDDKDKDKDKDEDEDKDKNDDSDKDESSTIGVIGGTDVTDIEVSTEEAYSLTDEEMVEQTIEDALELCEYGKYAEALAKLDTAGQLYGYSEDLNEAIDDVTRYQTLDKVDEYIGYEKYEEGINYIVNNYPSYASDSEMLERYNICVIEFRDDVIEDAEDAAEYSFEGAISVLEDGLDILPGDEDIMEMIEYYQDKIIPPMPSTTAEIVNFYSDAVDKIVYYGEGGFTKKEWQNVDQINIGADAVNSAVTSVLGNFLTLEEDAAEQVCGMGSEDARVRFPEWTLTDLSQIQSASCIKNANGNYEITIIMKDEDTPKRSGSVLGQVTNSILYWEDIEYTLENDDTVNAILSSYSGIHINYVGFRIKAEITPDGEFVYLDHTADIDIIIGEAKLLQLFTIKDKQAHMWNYCKYYNFVY